MAIAATSTINPQRNSGRYALSAAAGAGVGVAARYLVPNKAELSNVVKKDTVDTFVSSAKMNARAAQRSSLKYAGIGALAAIGLHAIHRAFKGINEKTKATMEYSKLGALIDAPDYACEIMWYGEP